jgi:hypothetical protein
MLGKLSFLSINILTNIIENSGELLAEASARKKRAQNWQSQKETTKKEFTKSTYLEYRPKSESYPL